MTADRPGHSGVVQGDRVECSAGWFGGPDCREPAVEAVAMWQFVEGASPDNGPVYVVVPVCGQHGWRRVSLDHVDQAQDALGDQVWTVKRS